MGWTAYYQILRDRPLDDDELGALRDYIDLNNRPPWDCESFGLAVTREARADQLLGWGWQKLAMNTDESTDAERLEEVLDGLAGVVPGVELRVRDDFDAMARGPELIDLADGERDGFQAPALLLGPRHDPLADAVIASLTRDEPALEELVEILRALATLDDDHPARAGVIERLGLLPPLPVAAAGFAAYEDIHRSRAWRVVEEALDKLVGRAALAEVADGFLSIWAQPRGIYWYGDLSLPDDVRDELAALPAVEAHMLADLAAGVAGSDSEIVHRRAEHAAHMLGRAGTPEARRALLEAARTLRGKAMPTHQRYHTFAGIYEGLVRMGGPDVVPTLLLDLGAGDPLWRHRRTAIGVLARHAPTRVAPLLAYMAASGEALWELVPALQLVAETAEAEAAEQAREALMALCQFPHERTREQASAALRAIGGWPQPPVEQPPPEELVTHRAISVRHDALREIDKRGDRAHVLSMVTASALDLAIRRSFDNSRSSLDLVDRLLPDNLAWRPLAQQLAWVRGPGAAQLPEQVVWPSIEHVLAGKIDEIAASYPPPWPRIDAASADALIAEEAAILDGDRDVAPAPITLVAFTPPPPASPSSAPAPLIDELLGVMLRDEVPDRALIERAGLPRDLAGLDRWDRQRAVRSRLLAEPAVHVADRIVSRLREVHEKYEIRDVADEVMARAAADDPTLAERLLARWTEAHDLAWPSPSSLTGYLTKVAAQPAIFERMLEELAAPDDRKLSNRYSSAIEVLSYAAERREDAAAALVARLVADRGRPRELAPWRGDVYRALRKLEARETEATAILELGELNTITRASALIELLALLGGGNLALVAQAIDLPELARDATGALCKLLADAERAAYLAHPFWKVRLAAADAARDWNRTKVECFAVWAAIDAAGLPLSDDERRYARPDGAAVSASWHELARAHGQPITLPPLPPLVDGFASPCADHRTWSLAAADEKVDGALAVARVYADELDRALATHAHLRTAARWGRWREQVPALPLDRKARLAWAAGQADAALPPPLARVRDEGAEAVAAAMPTPNLAITAAQRAELLAREAPIAARGAGLLRSA